MNNLRPQEDLMSDSEYVTHLALGEGDLEFPGLAVNSPKGVGYVATGDVVFPRMSESLMERIDQTFKTQGDEIIDWALAANKETELMDAEEERRYNDTKAKELGKKFSALGDKTKYSSRD